MASRIVWVGLAVTLAGCASTELNYNTLDIASTTDSLISKQVLYNLANFMDSDLALPAQIVISSGTATTADTLTGSATAPLSKSITGTSQLVNTASSNPSLAATNLTTAVKAGASLTGGVQDVRTQNYAFQMITDPYQLWRLKSLYRFAIDGDENKFLRDYPRIYKTINHQRNVCLQDQLTRRTVYGTATNNDPSSGLPNSFVSCITSAGGGGSAPTMTKGQDTYSDLVPDPYYLTGPTCLICRQRNGKYAVNDRIKGSWLRWRALPGATRLDNFAEGDIPLGRYGHYELFVDRDYPEKFVDFTIFAFAASTQSDSAVSGGSGGGGASGAGGSGGGGSKGPQAATAGILIATPPIQ
jgi:hypothetical protein